MIQHRRTPKNRQAGTCRMKYPRIPTDSHLPSTARRVLYRGSSVFPQIRFFHRCQPNRQAYAFPMLTTRTRRQELPSPSIPQTTTTRPNPKQKPTSAKEALPTRECTSHKATKNTRRIPTIGYTCGRVWISQGR